MSKCKSEKKSCKAETIRDDDGLLLGSIYKKYFAITIDTQNDPFDVDKGLALDVATLKKLEEAGVRYVDMYNESEDFLYTAPLTRFWWLGVSGDRGYGDQRILPLEHWTKVYYRAS